MAQQAIFAAQLLAGEMPPEIEEAFAAAGVSLFPGSAGDLAAECTCPDWTAPCKHAAATHYILGEQFDEDPFLLFRLRGRTQDQILAALRARRSAETGVAEPGPEYEAEAEAVPATPLAALVDSFWQPAMPLDGLLSPVKPPAVALPLLKRLGPPAFLPDQDLAQLLGPAYEAISRAALRAAFGDREENGSGHIDGADDTGPAPGPTQTGGDN